MEQEIDLTVETVEEAHQVRLDALRHGVQLDLLKVQGPGGGWPAYRVSGPPDAVRRFLASVGYDDDET